MSENSTEEHLLIATGTGEHTVVALSRAVTHIGRGFHADVHLDDHTVSRRHALLVRTRDGTRLIDDRSANGTCVNGEPVTDVVLADGDVLTLGTTTLTYCTAQPKASTWMHAAALPSP
jgi:pSer/pThr/pTyr-binding forkhead associated (FHA) protein